MKTSSKLLIGAALGGVLLIALSGGEDEKEASEDVPQEPERRTVLTPSGTETSVPATEVDDEPPSNTTEPSGPPANMSEPPGNATEPVAPEEPDLPWPWHNYVPPAQIVLNRGGLGSAKYAQIIDAAVGGDREAYREALRIAQRTGRTQDVTALLMLPGAPPYEVPSSEPREGYCWNERVRLMWLADIVGALVTVVDVLDAPERKRRVQEDIVALSDAVKRFASSGEFPTPQRVSEISRIHSPLHGQDDIYRFAIESGGNNAVRIEAIIAEEYAVVAAINAAADLLGIFALKLSDAMRGQPVPPVSDDAVRQLLRQVLVAWSWFGHLYDLETQGLDHPAVQERASDIAQGVPMNMQAEYAYPYGHHEWSISEEILRQKIRLVQYLYGEVEGAPCW